MAPGGGGKRKRGDRTYSHDSSNNDGARPSPHRPGNLNLAQQGYQQQGQQHGGFGREQHDQRGRGGRRSSRGGRGGANPRSPMDSPNAIPVQSRPVSTASRAMSPPYTPAQRSNEPKQSAAPRQQTPTVTASTQTPVSAPSPADPYRYKFLTKETVAIWQQSGRRSVVESGAQARKNKDSLVLGALFQEIIKSGLDHRIEPSDAGSVIREILDEDLSSQPQVPDRSATKLEPTSLNAPALFLDCLSILTETDYTNISLRPMILSTGIPPLLMRQELESTILEHLGLIRNTFVRVGIRQQTNLLYRQSNYNLLREETEGYSKLVTELFTTSSNEPPSSEVVEDTFEKVKGMIGAFDLDVGRVLDVTLDVFAAVLVKQYRFFVKYLRASSWWPQEKLLTSGSARSLGSESLPRWALPGSASWVTSEEEKDDLLNERNERDRLFWERVRGVGMSAFFEIGGRRVGHIPLDAVTDSSTGQEPADLDEDRKWIEGTGTLPPPGNKVAAQVLGFKLRFYSSSARDSSDILPVNLIYLAALLIKIGFISLRDLYPHLWPADEAMENVKVEKMKEKAEREKLNRPGGGAMNALMSAGALADDTAPANGRLRESDGNRGTPIKPDSAAEKTTTIPKVEEKEHLPDPLDQKVQLLKSLLCIGAIPESLYMLGRFPWLPDAFPDLPEYIHRILNHCLSKVYGPLQPLRERIELREQQRISDLDQTGVAKGHVRRIDAPVRKVLRWAQLDKEDTNEGTDYRFYWDDWADNVPVCQSVDDVFSLCGTLLNYTGVKIGQDPALLLKLARIGSYSLTVDTSESNMARWIDLSKRLLVPALSLTRCNPGVVNEVFELIKNFPTTTRYAIYTEWYSGSISRLPDIKAAFDQARAETKDVLKRISKTNVKPMARALAKVAYASPGIVFAVAIGQIESYDNLVEVVVECARYFTYLGYDVLTWSLMSSLGARGRNRVQADGMLTSRWLAALSLFAGKVFKRYSIMSPTPILQYVTEQLRKNNSTDLIVLEEITGSMAGIVSDTNFNESQVLSMAGGDLLQSQTMLQLLDRRHESKTTAKRLMKSLVEPKLAGQLLISIAQERQTCVFKIPEPDAHLKLLGNLFDEIHRVFTQYLDLLRSNLSIKEFDSLVPGVSRLIGDFGIEPSVAFWISRPSIIAAMAEHDAKAVTPVWERKDVTKGIDADPDKADIDMSDSEAKVGEQIEERTSTETDDFTAPLDTSAIFEQDTEMKDAMQPTEAKSTKLNGWDERWHPVLREIMDALHSTLPDQTWETISAPFYVTFWQLSLRDMLVPTQSYDDEINRQKKKILAINSDRSDISVAGTQKKDREKKILTDLQDRLRTELKDQVQSYSATRSRLQKEKEHWFANLWGKWDALNIALIEHCFFPRILISPIDAVYCFKMLKFLHSSGATNFRTMGVLDQLFNEKRLTSMMFLCTSRETENIGRFLNEVLRDLGRWHADKAVFEKEAYGTKKDLPGFCKKMTNEKTIIAFWTYEDFRRVLLKWHRNLHIALKTCVSGGEYMHIRNAIIVLKAVHAYFPAINWMGQAQVSSITELSKTESREDLKIAATSLLGNLKRREKDWMLPQAFNLNEATTNGTNGARAGSARPSTPQPEPDISKPLNANAAEFKPSPRVNVNGAAKHTVTSSGKLEVEDGEIDDAILTNLAMNAALAKVSPQAQPAAEQQPLAAVENENPTHMLLQEAANNAAQQQKQPGNAIIAQQTESQLASNPKEISPKPSVNAPATHPSVPTRPDLNRSVSESTSNARLQHSLPNRPDGLPPPRAVDHRVPERPGDRGIRDRVGESHFPEHVRTDRPSEPVRDRIPERHPPGTYARGYERPSDRPSLGDRERLDSSWVGEKSLPGRPQSEDRYNGLLGRDTRPAPRDERSDRPSRDRPYPEPSNNARPGDHQGQSFRETPMAPPRSNIPQHPDRAALIHGPQETDRVHLSNHSDRRPEPLRYESRPSSQRGSRAPSPVGRDDLRPPRHESRRDDRSGPDNRRSIEDISHSHSARHEDSRPPTGPRTDRSGDVTPSGPSDRFRDSLRAPSAILPPADPNHGRLNQDLSNSGRAHESQYGRLNSGPEIPSGPRLSNGAHPPSNRAVRNASGPQPQINTQQAQTAAQKALSSPDKQAPTGPSSSRTAQRTSTQFSRPPPTPSSGPTTPSTESPDIAGIHPDRLKAIQGPGVTISLSASQSQANNNHRISNQTASSPISGPPPAAPRGPNNAQPSSPVGTQHRGPPTGPSFANDRSRGDKRFAGLQNMLQQGGVPTGPERSGQGASIRGRGGRGNNANNIPSPVTSGPPTPSVTTRPDPFATARPDLFAARQDTPPQQLHGDEDNGYGRGGRRDGARDIGREGERRSARHRGSRSHSRDRHQGPFPVQPAQARDENRSARRGDEIRDRTARGGSGVPGADREGRRPGRDDLKDRDRRAESDRRDMEEWSGDRRGPLGLERRDERERDRRDGGRKRGRAGDDGGPGPVDSRGMGDGKRPRRAG